ncbi:GNAT family N-acetyltransferase [Amaricoccus sp.]|uniref:GNAT family N-acetyltransferase n=1 Tax=Amaricoccus sp. TaxID=1872485 RepID=UPI001B6CF668|nr:GNAT family N-acetyltransferase [Amaricoccus sp.]MBP7243560.1 GNAT family N-acetyltransferase [Amaricoccus sp.]
MPEPEILVLGPDAAPEALAAARDLMRRFVAWQWVRHADWRHLIDRYFDADAFEEELAGLPGKYAPPRGRLLLALLDGSPCGCVALRDLGDGVCEMKRMFVALETQRRGVGRALGARLLAEAEGAGYRLMRLDTGTLQHEAKALYESLGFRRIDPYYDTDPEMAAFLTFMERDLSPASRGS